MRRWLTFIGSRLIMMAVTMLIIITVTFFLMHALPGTPYANQALISNAQLAQLNKKYGFDQPLIVQYFAYLNSVLHGDFGISLQFSDQPVTTLMATRIGPSIQLGLQAVILGTIVGVLLGALAAANQNTWIDRFCSSIAILGRSVPNYVVAVIVQSIFAISLKLLPVGLWDQGFRSTILPTIALSIAPLADAARFIRTEMIDVLTSDYIELARAKGMSEPMIIIRHALRNSLIPLITVIGPMIAGLMTGSLVIETIFSVPGIGEQFTKSILSNDYYTIMAVTIWYSAVLVVVVFLMDVLYQIADPRVRIVGKEGE
ncbi:peptide ABC transporter permease [Bifidobacterium hapali]|uniref:Peptide ABC transporter permease n=1 Tax=Bifidobacterium hapali TaxID=1630172 RepID=A0A261G414_9BIFI|nr:ABC transporter permease [Bifidobacterium hapali]OZG66157.1 peptide ABC transporter permease [Bifidobacterium hapali]